MTDLNKERKAFEAIKEIQDSIRREQLIFNTKLGCYTKKSGKMCVSANWTNGAWFVFERKAKAQAVQQSFEIGRLKDRITELLDERQDLYAQINNDQAVPENTEDWYLDEDEGLWLDHDGIDGTLCELGIGEVKPVKHKEYLITQSNTLYAARVWDSDDDHIAWKLFESEESALEAATYCKQMYEASESGAEG
ncbi:hypothetical protein NRA37_02725 [Acinetobacter baumannii]|nr:hypothetical protein [Acinetobacter baumannii]